MSQTTRWLRQILPRSCSRIGFFLSTLTIALLCSVQMAAAEEPAVTDFGGYDSDVMPVMGHLYASKTAVFLTDDEFGRPVCIERHITDDSVQMFQQGASWRYDEELSHFLQVPVYERISAASKNAEFI